jgi:tRNA (cmo5U34)-methyltransferase
MIPINQGMKALEYGAGTGLLSFLLTDKFSEITLMDNSEKMVKVMHDKVAASPLSNLKPLFWDLVRNDYDSSKFDCIFSQMVLHHVPGTEG